MDLFPGKGLVVDEKAAPSHAQTQLDLFELHVEAGSTTSPASLPPREAGGSQGVLRHPQANRQILLQHQWVAYVFRRARRRSIGFVVGDQGLSVSAPRWVAMSEVEQAIREKSSWILRKLHEQQERKRRLEATRLIWADGVEFAYLGGPVRLVLDPQVSGAVWEPVPAGADDQATLRLGLPLGVGAEQIREMAQGWLQRQARQVFEQRCAHFAPLLAVQVRRLSLSSASTRWGSAGADGTVRLNWRLVHFGMPIIDYVVVHELAHLRVMDHSPRFWEVVESVVPDYRQRRQVLQDDHLPHFA